MEGVSFSMHMKAFICVWQRARDQRENEFVLPFSFVQHETHPINKFNVWTERGSCVIVKKKQIEKLVERDLEYGVCVSNTNFDKNLSVFLVETGMKFTSRENKVKRK